METVLVAWIDQTNHNIPLSQSLIQSTALTLFISLKAEGGEEATEDKFDANHSWFMRFKKSSHLHEIKTNSKAASANVEATASYPENLAKIINEDGYTKQQIFSVDKTTFYWKKMLCRTFLAKEEKSKPGVKASRTGWLSC